MPRDPSRDARGTHVLGAHATILIRTAKRCHPENTTPQQRDNVMAALLQCLDLTGGNTIATRPRAASPTQPSIANRTRANPRQATPMNPVAHHYGAGQSRAPNGDSDSSYWHHEYQRVHTHYDRCEVVRRTATHLEQLIRRDPTAPIRVFTHADQIASALIEGRGWPLQDVARRYGLTERAIAVARIDKDLHPLTGLAWTPPEANVFAARAAREMREAGMVSTDIALALNRSANTIRAWTTGTRRAA